MDSLALVQDSRAGVTASHAAEPDAGSTAVQGPAELFGRSLAVIIGINAYGEGIRPLRSAVADAKAIAETLRRDHGFETWCLFDDEAGLPHLLALLSERLPAALGPADRLLLYFAGHGIALDGDSGPAGYLVPAGAPRSEPGCFLPMHVLHGELTRLPVRHALVILDCCFAGTFRWASLRDIDEAVPKIYRERYERYLESAAWQVLTSASSDQLALDMLADDRGEGAGTHSPFARALLDGLAGAADLTGDHLITADELAIYVREHVAPAAATVGRRQVPQLFPLERHDSGQFLFQVPGRALALDAAPVLDEQANPYRGLAAFHEEDSGLFFGRDEVVERLVEVVPGRPLTVVVGPSGSGKSSVVHAGLVPALRAQGWEVLPTQRPGHEPLAALDAWARALGGELASGDPAESWATAVAARTAARPEQPWLVIIDQFEELLTHRTIEPERRRFLEALASALRVAPWLRVVVTVRSDAEPQFHDTALTSWWTTARFAIPAMTRDELRQVITEPAAVAVLHFEPSRLVERLLDDVALVPAPLPLLSFALSELYRQCWARWQRGICDRGLYETDYDEMGSVARALTQRATAVHDRLVAEDADHESTIKNVFVRMVAVVGGEVARRRVPRDELVYEDAAENRRVHDVLQRFHEARLISLGTEEDSNGLKHAYAEPTHDELVRGWTKVGQWLDELDATGGTRSLRSALGDAVRAWKTHDRADSYLWSDPRVELLSTLGQARRFVLNADESQFVRDAVRRRRTRRARLIGGLLTVIAVLTVAAGVALWQQRRAEDETERAERETERANQKTREAAQEAERATREAAENQRLLAESYQEAGRQLLLDGHAQEALPYLMTARQKGEGGEALGMLIRMAARLLPRVPLLQHQKEVLSAAFSPDGTRVVTASSDQTARVWDAATGKPLGAPLQHQGKVVSAGFNPDGTRVVTASDDGTARVWDAATGKPLGAPLQHQEGVRSAAFSPDGTRVVTASTYQTAHVWDAATGKPLGVSLRHQGGVRSAAFSPDGTRVVTASDDGTARVWDAATGKPRDTPLRHQGPVNTAAFSPDGTRVVTASDDGTARVWDAATGKPLGTPLQHQGWVVSAAFSSDGTRVITARVDLDQVARALGRTDPDDARAVTASTDQAARVWEAATGKPLGTPFQHQGGVRSAAFSPDGTHVVTANGDGTARTWDAATGKPLGTPLQHQGPVNSAAFSPDGTRVVTASDDGTARVWDTATGKLLGTPLQHQKWVVSATFSVDGTRVVTASTDQTARVWDAATGKPRGAPLQHQGQVLCAVFSPDGTRVVTASTDQTARVWDAATGKPLGAPLQHQEKVNSAAFSPDGTRIITASADQTAHVWDAATGTPLGTPLQHQGKVVSAGFNPAGTRIVTASTDRTARVWNASTGKPLGAPLQHQGEVLSAAFSPDGTRVITASTDQTARVWNASTGKPLGAPLQHQGAVLSAAFSPDGTRVVTASVDQTARMWDAATGKPLGAPLQHRGWVVSAAFSPNGTPVVTASSDQTAHVWDAATDKTSCAEWPMLAARSPFVLIGSGHVQRGSLAHGDPALLTITCP